MPYFVELHNRYKDKGVVVISVSADSVDTIDKAVRPFAKDKALPFSVHVLADRDPDAVTAVIGKELSGALPETLVYDKEGALKKSFEGAVTLEELEAEVKPLL
jgi:peroxiredoxin